MASFLLVLNAVRVDRSVCTVIDSRAADRWFDKDGPEGIAFEHQLLVGIGPLNAR